MIYRTRTTRMVVVSALSVALAACRSKGASSVGTSTVVSDVIERMQVTVTQHVIKTAITEARQVTRLPRRSLLVAGGASMTDCLSRRCRRRRPRILGG